MKEQAFHHGNLRAALIAAGTEAIDHAGVDDLSLRDLARRVGVSAPAAYRHFADKEALLLAIAEGGFNDLGDAVSAVTKEGSRPILVEMGLAYLGFARRRPGMFQLMFWNPAATGSDGKAATEAAAARALGHLAQAVAEAMGRAQEGSEPAVLRLWSTVHGLAMLHLAGRIDASDEAAMRAVLAPLVTRLGDA